MRIYVVMALSKDFRFVNTAPVGVASTTAGRDLIMTERSSEFDALVSIPMELEEDKVPYLQLTPTVDRRKEKRNLS